MQTPSPLHTASTTQKWLWIFQAAAFRGQQTFQRSLMNICHFVGHSSVDVYAKGHFLPNTLHLDKVGHKTLQWFLLKTAKQGNLVWLDKILFFAVISVKWFVFIFLFCLFVMGVAYPLLTWNKKIIRLFLSVSLFLHLNFCNAKWNKYINLINKWILPWVMQPTGMLVILMFYCLDSIGKLD